MQFEREEVSNLMVSTYPPDRDGIASYTRRLVEALSKLRISVRVLSNGGEWKRDSLSYVPSLFRKIGSSAVTLVHFQLSYFMFGNEYYTGLFPLLLLGLKVMKKKMIVTFHDVVPLANLTNEFMKGYTNPRFLTLKRWALIMFTKFVCSLADTVIVHDNLARIVLAKDYGITPEKLAVIPHGIDRNCYPSKQEVCFHERTITYFGLVRKGKGLENLVRAWPMVREKIDATLLIIGGRHPHLEDDCYERVVALIEDLRLDSSVRLCGYVPSELLPSYFMNTSAFVFPFDEWGDVVASSGALSVVAPYGKPLVVTEVPAFFCLKRDKAALFVNRGLLQELASAIITVLEDGSAARKLQEGLNRWLSRSGWEVTARKHKQLYERCFNKKSIADVAK